MNPIGAVQRWAICVLALIILGGAFGAWERHQGRQEGEAAGKARIAALTAEYAQASTEAADAARARHAALQTHYAAIAAQNAQELQHAKQNADRVIADLRTGTLKLRRQWRGCEATAGVSGTAAGPGQPDAAADLRAASAAAIVRIAADADARVGALQRIVAADRK